MSRFLVASALGFVLTAGASAQSPYVTPHYAPPIGGPVSPHVYVGARYSFYQPSFYSSSYYQPSYTQPQFDAPKYLQPGPYWYTGAYSFTPGYYSYYYTPGYFRY